MVLMRFHLLCLSRALVLGILISSYSQAMQPDDNHEKQGALIMQTTTSTPNSLDNLEEGKLKIRDLRGFQSFYETKVSDEEWKQIHQILVEATKTVTICNAIGNWLDNYESMDQAYYLLYKDLLKNPEKAQKKFKGQEKKLLEPLCNYVIALEGLLGNIKEDYQSTNQDYALLEKEILKVVQPTFNQYIQAYELLTAKFTTSLGSLNYQKLFRGSKCELFYKRDPKGFFIFTIDQAPKNAVGSNLFEASISYKSPEGKASAHSVLFSFDQNNRLVVEKRSGLIFRTESSILGSDNSSIFITPYCGEEDEFIPYSIRATLALSPAEEISSFRQKINSAAVGTKHNTLIHHFDEDTSEVLEAQVPPKSLNFFYDFGTEFLENRSSAFLPYPSERIERLELEYLFLKNFAKRVIQEGLNTPENAYLFKYLQESYPNQKPEEVIENYEQVLLEAYEDDELKAYEEQVLKEQEEVRKKVVDEEHYKKSGKSKKKKKPTTKPFNNKKSLKESNVPENDVTIREKISERVKKRLDELKEQANGIKPIKFRKHLRFVNAITQELVREGADVTARLRESSHGDIVIKDNEGEKNRILMHRPHGFRNMITSKNGKGILEGLINAYMGNVMAKNNE